MNAYTVERILKAYEQMVMGESHEDQNKRYEKGEYSYIPLELDNFGIQLQTAAGMVKGPIHFVDVGCGIGTKLITANELVRPAKVTGIEIHKPYVTVARNLVKSYAEHNAYSLSKFNVIEGDARTQSYKDYDIIYFYCPMSRPTLQQTLEHRIIRTAKKGAYIITNMKQGGDKLWEDNPKVERVWKNVIWRKK